MADSDSSHTVIISCAAVGAVILLFLAVKVGLYIHRRTRKPVPLPPARPLASLHTLPWNANPSASPANFSSSKFDLASPSSWSPSTYHPEFSLSQHGVPENRARNVYRQYSGSTLYTEEMPLHQPPSPLTRASSPIVDASLVPPQPSFFFPSGMSSNRSSAQLSVNSSTEDSDLASYPPQRHQSMTTALPSDPLAADDSGGSLSGTPPLADSYPRRGHGTGPQRLSVATSVSTIHTTRSKRSTRTQSAIRGPPHKPFSRVEVVLPAPLAPPNQPDSSSYVNELYGTSTNDSASNRGSVCDPWLRVGRESTGPTPGPNQANGSRQSSRERERRHRTVSSESRLGPRTRRPSASSISSFTANSVSVSPNPTAHCSRSPSVSSSHSLPYPHPLRHKGSSTTVDLSDLPPVPRVPSMYTNGTNSPISAHGSSPPSPSPSTPSPAPVLALSDSITGNGRLRGLESDSAIRNKSLSSSGNLSSSRSVVIAAETPA